MISYCSLGKYHPSILSYDELQQTFSTIQSTYPSKFSHSPENIIDMSKTIKTSCVSLNKAVYLSIPLFSEQLFEYYYLLPIPFKQESKILSMIPEHKILLKGKNIPYSTNKHCI
uniref:Uncharacterized protein n=1 Tax=Cacopsylla melanoneura TaxID=428564 RepID=A0A8D8TIM7_9HEMI